MHDDPTLPLTDEQRTLSGLAPAREAAKPQATWGPFQLLARVGHGGFGEVYRAWDPTLEREVALKLLLPGAAGVAQSDQEYQAMLREARALAAIQHPNIVRVYGIDRHVDRVGFWTDFVKGKTLSSLLGAQGPFGYREAALIALDITRALSAVHRAGILHRDIKAENVMREEGGRILLMDFGLSSLPQRQTHVAGTPSYIAPELWYGEPATVQSDIYAMGVLLFHLVTGEYPVALGGLSAEQAVAALKNRRTLLDFRSDLPESFLRAVATATEADPAQRFSSAGQLAAALSESLGTTAPAEAEAISPSRRSRGGLVRAGIAAVVLVLALAPVGWQSQTIRHWLHLEPSTASVAVPTDVSDEYLKAKDLLQHSYKDANLAAAVQGFQNVLAQDPSNALAEAGLGAAYFAQYGNSSDTKLLEHAKAAISKALQFDPKLAPAYATLARMEAMAGNTDLAFEQAQKAIKLDPRSPEAHTALAEVYDAQGKDQDAIEEIQKAIDLAPDNSLLLVRLGNLYFSSGDIKESAAALQKSVALDPENITALYDLGIANMHLGRLDDARADFSKVLQIEPDADSYKALGEVSMIDGKLSEAVAMDRKAIAINSHDRQAWGNLASAYLWNGQRDLAMQSYRKAIDVTEAQRKSAPNDPELLIDLADYYASVGDSARSIPLARKALVLSPDEAKIAYFAGETYELLGQRTMAIQLISSALAKGYQSNLFERSPELASLRNDPAFQAALVKAKSENAVDTAK